MRPIDVLAQRAVMYTNLTRNQTFESSIGYTISERAKSNFHNMTTAKGVVQITESALRMGETFLVTAEMAELAMAAQADMPPEPLVPQDLPSSHGFLWVEGGIQSQDIRGVNNSTSVFTWSSSGGGIAVLSWAYKWDKKDEINVEMHKQMDVMLKAPDLLWTGWGGAMKFGHLPPTSVTAKDPIPASATVAWTDDEKRDGLLVNGKEVETINAGRNLELSFLLAAWRLMQQTISSTRREEVPAKKVRRFDLKDTMVSVITLRHRAPYHEGETHVEWRHRWVVRGHWRHQPYKDSDGTLLYRWIYINPFMKGPEGAPLKRSEKINVWKQ